MTLENQKEQIESLLKEYPNDERLLSLKSDIELKQKLMQVTSPMLKNYLSKYLNKCYKHKIFNTYLKVKKVRSINDKVEALFDIITIDKNEYDDIEINIIRNQTGYNFVLISREYTESNSFEFIEKQIMKLESELSVRRNKEGNIVEW